MNLTIRPFQRPARDAQSEPPLPEPVGETKFRTETPFEAPDTAAPPLVDFPARTLVQYELEVDELQSQTQKLNQAEMVRQYEAGAPIRLIGETFHCGTTAIYQHLRNAGVTLRRDRQYATPVLSEPQARLHACAEHWLARNCFLIWHRSSDGTSGDFTGFSVIEAGKGVVATVALGDDDE